MKDDERQDDLYADWPEPGPRPDVQQILDELWLSRGRGIEIVTDQGGRL